MNDDRNAASGSLARMRAIEVDEAVTAPPALHAAQQRRGRVLEREVEVRHDGRRARASSTSSGSLTSLGYRYSSRTRARPVGASRSRRRSSGASAPGSPMSRPYQARSWATRTISATPPSTSDAHLGLDRVDGPRALLAAERRDRAERARAVAALGDLHVRPRRRRRGPGQLEQVPDAGRLAAHAARPRRARPRPRSRPPRRPRAAPPRARRRSARPCSR